MNKDGHRDIVSGCYEGVPYWVPGSADGLTTPELIRDKNDKLMDTGRLWNPDTREHSEGVKPDNGPAGRAYSALRMMNPPRELRACVAQ